MKRVPSLIKGHLDIKVVEEEDEFEGEISKWNEVYIHGDPDGLKSLGKLLLYLADLDQTKDPSLPVGAREHYHLRPGLELAAGSHQVIVGRLDAKGTGEFYSGYTARKLKKNMQ